MGRRRALHVRAEDDLKPVIAITHAAFDEARRISLRRLLSELRLEAPTIPVIVHADPARYGALWCWRQAMAKALATDATHIVRLPDDAHVCDDFGAILTAAIAARPSDVFDCYVNKAEALEVLTPWYCVFNGFTGMGGVMPRDLLEKHLRWRDRQDLKDYPDDAGVDLWAMATGRLIYKTSWSLVEHDDTMPSLEGHDNQPGIERRGLNPVDAFRRSSTDDIGNFLGRTYAAPTGHNGDYRSESTFLGKTYLYNHLHLLELVSPPRVERYWDVERGNGIPEDHREVMFAFPGHHRNIDDEVMASAMLEKYLCEAAGWSVEMLLSTHDSLVNRARNRILSHFLCSKASHLLMWDRDNYPIQPGGVLKLLETDHDIVGGAVPLKDGSGTKFASQLGRSAGEQSAVLENECLPAVYVGTGFMLISRAAVIAMATRYHAELFYLSGMPDSLNRAEWHLFADAVYEKKHLSEDWMFCRRWLDMGGKVYLRPDIDFVHVGEHPYVGSFTQAFGGRVSEEEKP